MRKIFPTDDSSKILASTNCKPITEQQYIDLVNKVNAVEDLIEATDAEIEAYKDEQATAITTCDINATNVNATDIVADTAQVDSISATTISTPYLTSDSSNTTVNDLVVTGSTVVKDVTADDVVADSITVDNATICNLTTDTFNPETIDTCVLTANDVTAICVTATDAAIDNAVIDTSTISTGNIAEAYVTNVEVSCAVVQEETVQTSTIDCLDNKYLTHTNEPQHISETGDIYIVLPKFTNGTYVLEGENDDGAKLFSIEFDNSQENIRFKWSVNTQTYLKDVEFINDVDGVQFVQLHAYTFGEEITLYFHSDSLDNTNPPQVYTSRQYEGVNKYEFSTQAGTYLPNSVFAGTFHAESMVVDDTEFQSIIIDCNICLPTGYDIYGCPIGHTNGQPGQYITPVELDNGDQGIKWESPATSVERGNTKLITSDGVSCYDGKVCVGVDLEDNPIYEYPIKELNECTTVHGTITTDNAVVNCGICNPHLFIGLTCDYNNATLADDALVILTDEG